MITAVKRVVAAAALVMLTAPVVAVANAIPACAAAEVRVSVVVDFGDLASPPPTTTTCVAGGDGDSGAEILAARAQQLGRPAPRYNSSGLLCAIDGLPSTGCGERTSSGGYRYWSYWHGTGGGWEYSSVGPTGSRVRATQSEGWRFTDGTGRPGDPAPRGPADPGAVCRPAQSPPATAATATTAAVSSSASRSPSPAGSTGTSPVGSPAARAATTQAAGGVSPSTAIAPEVSTSTSEASVADDGVAASARRQPSSGDGGGRVAGTAFAAIAVVALAGGGAVAARRRRRA
ncbi:MAG: hypothetical protein QOE35_4050 [Actinomycetota bacterium]|jgi:hypothetical protein